MDRLTLKEQSKITSSVNGLYEELVKRCTSNPEGTCPVDFTAAFLRLCYSQSCGKCTPCRIGLGQLTNMVEDVLDGSADLNKLDLIESLAQVIFDSSDCAIGYEAAGMVLNGLSSYWDDFISHIENGECAGAFTGIPCVSLCPANVDIPGYIALTREGRYADAIKVIRNDNPFPAVCALICEHPCESHCRRGMIDDAINIRGIKRFAVDNAGEVPPPEKAAPTGKKVAVIGGGPSGLTAAYYLSLMGHNVTIFEKRERLGGMLRYGIPIYRLPDDYLDRDINVILGTGIQVKTGVDVKDIEKLRTLYDSIYISIGAHTDKKLGIDGEDKEGVISAVDMLRAIGDNSLPDFSGKNVVIVGGGNVAMDVTRTSMRLGAASVKCVYRRRQEDMTALPEEIEGAIAEGCEIVQLKAPVRVEGARAVTGLVVQPQIIGDYDWGRPKPRKADLPEEVIPCDIVIVAIGQDIESESFENAGIPVKRARIQTENTTKISEHNGIFSGGDCVSGPATVIKAIEAGKVAAANIDNYLGFDTKIEHNVEIPKASYQYKAPCGRINLPEREAAERKNDFDIMEHKMTSQEASQECSRCLRCDFNGFGALKGGNNNRW